MGSRVRTLLVCWFAATITLSVCAPQDGIVFPDENHTDDVDRRSGGSKPPLVSNGNSVKMCKKYAENVFFKVVGLTGEVKTVDVCVLVEPLIVNGSPAQPREFPHMALIGYPSNQKNQPKKWLCGGSLISERYVLSAAHCNKVNSVEPKWVRLGEYNYLSKIDDEDNNARPEDYNIVEIIAHPEYDPVKIYNDITLYKTNENVAFNEYIRPTCLHTEHQLPKSFFIISGWGSVEFGERGNGSLLKGNVSYVPGNECGEILKPSFQNKNASVQDNTMICAGNFRNGTDTCQGDSGGPLQYPLEVPYCMYSQVGITSLGLRCGWSEGQPKYPAVYTRVSYFVPWIESIVWP